MSHNLSQRPALAGTRVSVAPVRLQNYCIGLRARPVACKHTVLCWSLGPLAVPSPIRTGRPAVTKPAKVWGQLRTLLLALGAGMLTSAPCDAADGLPRDLVVPRDLLESLLLDNAQSRIRELSDSELLSLFKEVAKAPSLTSDSGQTAVPGGIFSRFSRWASQAAPPTELKDRQGSSPPQQDIQPSDNARGAERQTLAEAQVKQGETAAGSLQSEKSTSASSQAEQAGTEIQNRQSAESSSLASPQGDVDALNSSSQEAGSAPSQDELPKDDTFKLLEQAGIPIPQQKQPKRVDTGPETALEEPDPARNDFVGALAGILQSPAVGNTLSFAGLLAICIVFVRYLAMDDSDVEEPSPSDNTGKRDGSKSEVAQKQQPDSTAEVDPNQSQMIRSRPIQQPLGSATMVDTEKGPSQESKVGSHIQSQQTVSKTSEAVSNTSSNGSGAFGQKVSESVQAAAGQVLEFLTPAAGLLRGLQTQPVAGPQPEAAEIMQQPIQSAADLRVTQGPAEQYANRQEEPNLRRDEASVYPASQRFGPRTQSYPVRQDPNIARLPPQLAQAEAMATFRPQVPPPRLNGTAQPVRLRRASRVTDLPTGSQTSEDRSPNMVLWKRKLVTTGEERPARSVRPPSIPQKGLLWEPAEAPRKPSQQAGGRKLDEQTKPSPMDRSRSNAPLRERVGVGAEKDVKLRGPDLDRVRWQSDAAPDSFRGMELPRNPSTSDPGHNWQSAQEIVSQPTLRGSSLRQADASAKVEQRQSTAATIPEPQWRDQSSDTVSRNSQRQSSTDAEVLERQGSHSDNSQLQEARNVDGQFSNEAFQSTQSADKAPLSHRQDAQRPTGGNHSQAENWAFPPGSAQLKPRNAEQARKSASWHSKTHTESVAPLPEVVATELDATPNGAAIPVEDKALNGAHMGSKSLLSNSQGDLAKDTVQSRDPREMRTQNSADLRGDAHAERLKDSLPSMTASLQGSAERPLWKGSNGVVYSPFDHLWHVDPTPVDGSPEKVSQHEPHTKGSQQESQTGAQDEKIASSDEALPVSRSIENRAAFVSSSARSKRSGGKSDIHTAKLPSSPEFGASEFRRSRQQLESDALAKSSTAREKKLSGGLQSAAGNPAQSHVQSLDGNHSMPQPPSETNAHLEQGSEFLWQPKLDASRKGSSLYSRNLRSTRLKSWALANDRGTAEQWPFAFVASDDESESDSIFPRDVDRSLYISRNELRQRCKPKE